MIQILENSSKKQKKMILPIILIKISRLIGHGTTKVHQIIFLLLKQNNLALARKKDDSSNQIELLQ